MPSFTELLPAGILREFVCIGINLSLQPKIEPIEIAGVDREPMRRLPLAMVFIRKDVERHRLSGILKCRDAVDGSQKFLIRQLHQDWRIDLLRVERERYRTPEFSPVFSCVSISLEAAVFC